MNRKWWLILPAVLLLLALAAFLFRNNIFHYFLDKKIAAFEQRYDTKINYETIELNGISRIAIAKVHLIPNNCDTLLSIHAAEITIRLRSLLFGEISFNDFKLNGLDLLLHQTQKCNNFSRFFKKENSGEPKKKGRNYHQMAETILDKIFQYTPSEKTHLSNLNINYMNDTLNYKVEIPQLNIEDLHIKGLVKDVESKQEWDISGKIDRTNKWAQFSLDSKNNFGQSISFIQRFFNTSISFNQSVFEFSYEKKNDEMIVLKGKGSIRGLKTFHPKLSSMPVGLDKAGANFEIEIDNKSITLDSSTNAYFNNIKYTPFIRYTYTPSNVYEVKIKTATTDANTFIHSLPEGLVQNLDGMQLEGQLSYALNFMLADTLPDSCKFSSTLVPHQLKIVKYGKTDLTKMSRTFEHEVYEKGQYIRTIIVGPENPNFYPLNTISSYLRTVLMTAEDGAFMWHRGFNEDAFRKSIAENYKAGRFVRGGSTITMQLVKNVFLNRNKTISRKLEEALIVWFIENLRLTGKERMLETYLNVIEFGPNIYGIGEASRFYFAKRPAELTLGESIFLSSIVPRPKYFKYYFEKNGQLKPFMAEYFRFMANVLKYRKLITENEYNDLKPEVDLIGEARKLVTPADSLPSDFNYENNEF